jgi:HK97 family phage prohead protease
VTTLAGHFAVFDRWTEIASAREGHFLERVAPGAFRKSIAENRDRIRVLLSHGADPELGSKPIARLDELREDRHGGYYAAPLLEGLPELLVSGLRAGLYGASFRFESLREDFVQSPGRSSWNPRGLPERTLREVRLYELGPTPFPAYADASAGLRSARGDALELLPSGRREVLPAELRANTSGVPITIQRLRAQGSPLAASLLRALELGETVELAWGSRRLGRVVRSRGRTPTRTRPSWRLT